SIVNRSCTVFPCNPLGTGNGGITAKAGVAGYTVPVPPPVPGPFPEPRPGPVPAPTPPPVPGPAPSVPSVPAPADGATAITVGAPVAGGGTCSVGDTCGFTIGCSCTTGLGGGVTTGGFTTGFTGWRTTAGVAGLGAASCTYLTRSCVRAPPKLRWPPPPPPAALAPPAPRAISAFSTVRMPPTRSSTIRTCTARDTKMPHRAGRSVGTPIGGRYGGLAGASSCGSARFEFAMILTSNTPATGQASRLFNTNTTAIQALRVSSRNRVAPRASASIASPHESDVGVHGRPHVPRRAHTTETQTGSLRYTGASPFDFRIDYLGGMPMILTPAPRATSIA